MVRIYHIVSITGLPAGPAILGAGETAAKLYLLLKHKQINTLDAAQVAELKQKFPITI